MAQNEYRVYENPTDNPDYVLSEQVSTKKDAPDENAAEHKPKIKKKRNFSVSPSVENPSTVTPTADNPTADTIEKLNQFTHSLLHRNRSVRIGLN